MYTEKTLLMPVLRETAVSPQYLQTPGEPFAVLLALPSHLPRLPGLLTPCSWYPHYDPVRQTWKVWNVIRTQHTGVHFPSPPAAPGFESPMNVCWFLSSSMCISTSCWWIIDFVCGEIEASPRANEEKLCLKTSVLSKIHLNGNLQAENQLLFKWIIPRIRFLVVPENISQGCLCVFSWNNCVLAEVFCAVSPFHPCLFLPVRLL